MNHWLAPPAAGNRRGELHFHNLRHTGNTMAAAQGASLEELMERMGHSSPRAALIYLHATRERDQQIAAGRGKAFAKARKTRKAPGGGERRRKGIGHAVQGHQAVRKARLNSKSGRRESNPHDQLGIVL